MFLKNSIKLLFALLLMLAPIAMYAQLESPLSDIPDINAGLDEFSAPSVEINVLYSGSLGSSAQLTAQTNNVDNFSSLFEWYLDDQLIIPQSGRAKTSFSFQTSKPQHLARLVVSDLNKKKITENTVSVGSYDVSLVWQTNSFSPLDYEGRTMPSVGSRIIVTAISEIRNEGPENLIYTWYVNSESQVRGVLGEQTFSFLVTKNVTFMPVMVEVSNLSQSVTVRKGISIPIIRPSLALYQKQSQRLSSGNPAFALPGSQIDFYVQPFYFHINKAADLIYKWSFAGKEIFGTPPDPNMLTLIIPADSAGGRSMLEVKVENPRVLGEWAEAEMEINVIR